MALVNSEHDRQSGLDAFIDDVSSHARQVRPGFCGTVRFLLDISESYANIRLCDLKFPFRFLQQMADKPPKQFGTAGFDPQLVDDHAPARHYTAFIFVGFWLPSLLAILMLWLWEILGYIRYSATWSQNDVRLGYIGLRHGRTLRRYGPHILPRLIDRDLRCRKMQSD